MSENAWKVIDSGDLIDVAETLRHYAAEMPDVPALLAPGRPPLPFAGLSEHVESLAQALAGAGLGRDDVVATVLPDDAQTLCAFLGACLVAGFAPLNPDLHAAEFESSLRDLRPAVLLVPAGSRSPAAGAAESLGIPILEAHTTPKCEAGLFTLSGLNTAGRAARSVPQPSALALSLQTSATTGRAKFVSLSHANIAAMARASSQAMMLGRADRFLCMMPLFHLQGMLSAFEQLMVGGSVVCASPFHADRFPSWIDKLHPTWYTAGPALHRTILALLLEKPKVLRRSRLRFVRSIGSALPAALLRELEETLRLPVVEGYGLTEAGAVTSTPLSPYKSKAGSSGSRIVPGVGIMDEAGNLLPAGRPGEIVVQGPNVMREYRNDPESTRTAFRNGWFRTGDLGWFDAEGFLYVTGRTKEIVNRGGEKILPEEIDKVLMAHPDVTDAAAFAVPHPQLGDDLAAAVVLRVGAAVDETAIRDFLATRLTAFKVPSAVTFLTRIPKGATGKVQRSRLTDEFVELRKTRAAEHAAAAPTTDDERELAEIWASVLGIPAPGIDDDFFGLGGHSLASARILARIQQSFGVELRHDALLAAPTVRRLAALLRTPGALRGQIVAIQPEGAKPAFFMMRPLPIFRPLASRLPNDRPFLGVVMPRGRQSESGSDLPSVARQLVSVVRRQQPAGPYYLGGWCADGVVAVEMARQLTAQGETVALLALFDTPNPAFLRKHTFPSKIRRRLNMQLWNIRFQAASVRQLGRKEVPAYLVERLATVARTLADALRTLVLREPRTDNAILGKHHPSGIRLRIMTYHQQSYPGEMTLFRAVGRPVLSVKDPSYGWEGFARGGLVVHPVPGDHLSMFLEPNVEVLAHQFAAELERVDASLAAPRETAK